MFNKYNLSNIIKYIYKSLKEQISNVELVQFNIHVSNESSQKCRIILDILFYKCIE